jgi:hypothetical protein
MRFVNAYAVTRHFGGPEEGGWWFDRHEPLACVPLLPEMDEDTLRTLLEQGFGGLNEGDPSSVLGGTRVLVTTEEEPAAPHPRERPHYE